MFFDNIKLELLTQNLEEAGVEKKVQDLLQGISQDASAVVESQGQSAPRTLDARLARGSTWSPELATAFMQVSITLPLDREVQQLWEG